MEQRKGDWQETYTGKFYAIDPKKEEVNLLDIAHGLSLICRYAGQTKHFYSVAQHCLNVCNDLKQLGYGEEIQLIGLLHDASEVYISDLPSPFKKAIPEYKVFEDAIEKAIYQRFDLDFPSENVHKIIKHSDNTVLYNEAKVLMNNIDNWTSKYNYKEIKIDVDFRNMSDVENEYLEKANYLIKKIEEKRNIEMNYIKILNNN